MITVEQEEKLESIVRGPNIRKLVAAAVFPLLIISINPLFSLFRNDGTSWVRTELPISEAFYRYAILYAIVISLFIGYAAGRRTVRHQLRDALDW